MFTHYRVIVFSDLIETDKKVWACGSLKNTDTIIQINDADDASAVLRKVKDAGFITTVDKKKISISDISKTIIEIMRKHPTDQITQQLYKKFV